jgi:kanamycin nucleotidyltransferase
MDHQDRMRCAQELCNRLVEKYPDGIILGGLYGSTARGLDTARSDLELLFITRDGCGTRGQHLIYRGIPVGYMVMERSKLEELLTTPSLEGVCGWPFFMGVLSVLKVLWGERSRVDAWLKMGREVPEAVFRKALEEHLPQLILESYGRIFSCKERGNQDDWYCAVLEVLFEMRDALCLLNRSWVTHDYMQGMTDTFQFAILPMRYREIVPALWRARDIDEAIPLAKELVENFWQLMSHEGIGLRVYDSVAEIPV